MPSYIVNREESEMDFKEPLSPSIGGGQFDRRSSLGSGPPHYPSYARPPQQVTATFGLMGEAGVIVNIFLFSIGLIIDILLILALWNQANAEPNYYKQKEEKLWFLITLLIFLVSMILINILSLVWYIQNKEVLGVTGVFYKKTLFGKIVCVLLHVVLLGPITRYLDTIKYGKKIQTHLVEVDLGTRSSVQRLTPKGEVNSALQTILARDTSLLDMLHSFLLDCPQIVFQTYLLYKNPLIVTNGINLIQLTQAIQVLKILVSLLTTSWTMTSFQDELRRTEPGKKQLSCTATSTCLLWRASLLGSRVIAIGSFASLQMDGEGGLIKVHPENIHRGLMSFPTIAAIILMAHCIIVLVWICAQKTTFCNTYEGHPKSILELFYSAFMGWVHIFDYVNIKETPSRRRMIFFYLLIFIENTGFILVWFLQLVSKELWLRVAVMFSVEALFVIGISSAIGYYSFLHPDRNTVRQLNASWKT